jgi:hypothetical protein
MTACLDCAQFLAGVADSTNCICSCFGNSCTLFSQCYPRSCIINAGNCIFSFFVFCVSQACGMEQGKRIFETTSLIHMVVTTWKFFASNVINNRKETNKMHNVIKFYDSVIVIQILFFPIMLADEKVANFFKFLL